MSSESWQNLGNFVNSAGVAGFAVTGVTTVMAGYQIFASPYASLAESERKLKGIRSRLQELSPQRREKIDLHCRAFNCKTLKDIEEELDVLVDTYYRLSEGGAEITFAERHIPYSIFRKHVRNLESDTRGLFRDTLTTTVPHLDDMEFDPQNPGSATDRSSSSESPITFPIPSHPASSTAVDIIPMTRV